MEGPAFSTRAESNLYRSWGCSIIGMTNHTEARLAKEAEIAYSSLSITFAISKTILLATFVFALRFSITISTDTS